MTKMERVLTTLRGETPDRPPVCFWQHFGALEPRQTVAEYVKFYQESGEDILKMMCDEFFEYPLQGAKTPADFLALRPLGRDSYYVRGQVERATQINEALKGEVFSLYNAFSPYASLKHAMGDEASICAGSARPWMNKVTRYLFSRKVAASSAAWMIQASGKS